MFQKIIKHRNCHKGELTFNGGDKELDEQVRRLEQAT